MAAATDATVSPSTAPADDALAANPTVAEASGSIGSPSQGASVSPSTEIILENDGSLDEQYGNVANRNDASGAQGVVPTERGEQQNSSSRSESDRIVPSRAEGMKDLQQQHPAKNATKNASSAQQQHPQAKPGRGVKKKKTKSEGTLSSLIVRRSPTADTFPGHAKVESLAFSRCCESLCFFLQAAKQDPTERSFPAQL